MFFLDHKTVVTSNVHGLIYLQTLMSFCASPLGEGEARGSVAGIPPLMSKAGTPPPSSGTDGGQDVMIHTHWVPVLFY